jgi:hypothetical protein
MKYGPKLSPKAIWPDIASHPLACQSLRNWGETQAASDFHGNLSEELTIILRRKGPLKQFSHRKRPNVALRQQKYPPKRLCLVKNELAVPTTVAQTSRNCRKTS